MNVTVIYYESDSKVPKLKGFSEVQKAQAWIDKSSESGRYVNPQIMVPYAAIEAYQEMYELMRDRIFGTKEERSQIKEKKVI